MNNTPTAYYPRTGPNAFTLAPPEPVTVCPVCEYRTMLGYPLCDAHSTDVWAGAR